MLPLGKRFLGNINFLCTSCRGHRKEQSIVISTSRNQVLPAQPLDLPCYTTIDPNRPHTLTPVDATVHFNPATLTPEELTFLQSYRHPLGWLGFDSVVYRDALNQYANLTAPLTVVIDGQQGYLTVIRHNFTTGTPYVPALFYR